MNENKESVKSVKNRETIVIDDVEYYIDDAPENFKYIISHIGIVDNSLKQKEIELNIFKTAKQKLIDDLKLYIPSLTEVK